MKFVIGHHWARASVLKTLWPGNTDIGAGEGVGGGPGPGSGQNDIILVREILDK